MLVYQRIDHIISIQGEHHVQINISIHHIALGYFMDYWKDGKLQSSQMFFFLFL